MSDDQSLTLSNEEPPVDGLDYLEEMRLAKMVRNTMVGNGRRSLLQRAKSSRALISPERNSHPSRVSSYSPRSCSHRPNSSMLSDTTAWMSMKQFLQADKGNDIEEEVGISTNNDSRKRVSSLSDSKAWKSLKVYLPSEDSDDEPYIKDINDEDSLDENGDDCLLFYTKPVQRQLWGDPHLVVHIGWNTLFFDLFYVAAAYNLGNTLISAMNEDQWVRGVVYILGIFGGIYNTFSRCMIYDSQFSVHDYAHRLLEIVRIFLVSFVVLHIKSIELLMDPRSAESFALTTAMFFETLVHVFLNLELFYYAEGDTVAIKNQSLRELTTNLLPLSVVYLTASVVSGVLYFRETPDTVYSAGTTDDSNETTDEYDETRRRLGAEYADPVASGFDWSVADVPIVLCFVAAVASIVIQGISALKLTPNVPDIRSKIVPMNVDFFIHRFGEFTMLFFGEAVMGLLIVETTESNSYYVVAIVGVLNVIVLQAFKYESEPHGEGAEHCLWKGLQPFFAYSLLTQALCLGLIAFAVSFKVGLGILLSDHKTESYGGYEDAGYTNYDDGYGYNDSYSNNTSSYGDDLYAQDPHTVRALRGLAGAAPTVSMRSVQMLYCSSLSIVLIAIEMMAYSHNGLVKTYSLFVSKGETHLLGRIHWKRLIGTLFKIGLVLIVMTMYFWVNRPETLVAIGFTISIVFAFAKVIEHITETRPEKVKEIRKSISHLLSSTRLRSRR